MKWMTIICTISLVCTLLAGCATSLSKQAMISNRNDVFSAITHNTPIPPGQADLNISASLKTHKEFDCPINQQHSHGTAAYKLVLNIDGQSLPITAELKEENLTDTEADNPETGNGMRYTFRQKIRLPAGSHQLIVSLPDDGIAIKKHITLAGNTVNSITVTPVYKAKASQRSPVTVSDFHEGMKGFNIYLNGSIL